MAREAVEKFLQELPESETLREAYANALKRATESALAEVARTAGFEFSVDELRAVLDERSAQLSEDQLQQVAGGVATYAIDRVECYAANPASLRSLGGGVLGPKF